MKGLKIITDPRDLKLLGNEQALTILNMLKGQELSATCIEEKAGIKLTLAAYYLKRLENHGLIEVVRTEQGRGSVQKFYRATAGNFLIHSDMGVLSENVSNILGSAYIDDIQYRVMRGSIDRCVNTILRGILDIDENSRIVVRYNESKIEFVNRLILGFHRAGCEYRAYPNCGMITQDIWSNLPLESVEQVYGNFDRSVEWANAWINVGLPAGIDFSDIPQDRVNSIWKINSKSAGNLYSKEDLRIVTVNLLEFQQEVMNEPKILEKMELFWDVVSLTGEEYGRMKEIADKLLSGKKFIVESGEGCRLEFRPRIDCHILSAGPYTFFPNGAPEHIIPAGELALLPEGINGEIFCDTSPEHQSMSGVWLKIRDGHVTDFKAEKGEELIRSRFERNGARGRKVGEICFGLNAKMKDPKLLPEFASKMAGVINISFGDNSRIGGDISNINQWELTSLSPSVSWEDGLILEKNRFTVL